MEDDIKFSRNYLALFQDAKKIKNWDKAEEVLNEIYSELGIHNPNIVLAGAEQGKRAAEYMNKKHSPDPTARGGKKI
jgi:hypothetical protein